MTPADLRDRAIELALRVPVSVKVMGIALGLTLLLGGSLLWQIHSSWHRLLLGALEERGRLLGAYVADHGAEHLAARRTYPLESLLRDSRARIPEVAYLLVLDARGQVVAHTLSGVPSEELLRANALGPGEEAAAARLDTELGRVRDVAVPVLGGQVRVGMSEAIISSEVGWLTRRLIAVTAVIAALGILAALALTAILTRPLREMAGLARAVRDEDLDRRVRVRAGDELGRLAVAFNEMAEALRNKERARQKLSRQLIAAAEDERKRVARELHDGTGQALASLIAGLATLDAEGVEGARRDRLEELRALAAQTLGEVHDTSRTLRPAALDDVGLMPALAKHCEMVSRRFGLAVDCQSVGFENRPRLPAEVELATYRIAQEALANAVRHGGARTVHVLVQRKERGVLLVVEDDGRGFVVEGWRARSVEAGHLGLRGIDERAALLGGSLRIESAPGSGASLFVDLPVSGEVRRG